MYVILRVPNLRPVTLDGNSYIDSLSNHWSTYAIAHTRFRDTEYEVPAEVWLSKVYTLKVSENATFCI